MKRKKVIVCMLTAMLSVGGILTACGDKRSDETKENSNTKKDSDVTELELFMSKPETAEVMQEIADKFCEENPSVKISVTSSSDGLTVMQTRVASNEMPDILNTFPAEDFYKTIYKEGYIEDISEQEFLNKVSKSSLEMSVCDDGKYYAVPMSDSTYGV